MNPATGNPVSELKSKRKELRFRTPCRAFALVSILVCLLVVTFRLPAAENPPQFQILNRAWGGEPAIPDPAQMQMEAASLLLPRLD